MKCLIAACVFCLAGALRTEEVIAQDEAPTVLDLPLHDVAPAVRGRFVEVVALGNPDERFRRLSPRRESARIQGRQRAVRAIHRFVDNVLADLQVHPRVATDLHYAIDESAEESAYRPLVDGSATVQVRVPVSSLRRAAPQLTDVAW